MITNLQVERPPSFASLDDEPPQQSLPVVIATAQVQLKVWAVSQDSSAEGWVSIDGNTYPRTVGANKVTPHYLALRHYWQQVPGSCTQIYPGEIFTKTYQMTFGVADTDSTTVSSELGVTFSGLSAKIKELFSNSITVSAEMSEETQFEVSGPGPGFIRAWVLWQPVYELVALDATGIIVGQDQGQCWVAWGAGKDDGPASLSIPNGQQTFPQRNMIPVQQDFAAS